MNGAGAGIPAVARCPHCRRPASLAQGNPWRPFCSERCRQVDFGDWLSGAHALAAEEAPIGADEDSPADDPLH